MPTCAVSSCNNKSGCRFFEIPSDKIDKNTDSDLQARRRKVWLVALRRKDLSRDLTGNIIKDARICSQHFINEEPAALEEQDHPDWIPCINMGYPTKWTKAKLAKVLQLKQQKKEKLNKELTKKLDSSKQIKEPTKETPISSISPLQYDENLPDSSEHNNPKQNEGVLPKENICNDIVENIDDELVSNNKKIKLDKCEETEIESDLPNVIYNDIEIKFDIAQHTKELETNNNKLNSEKCEEINIESDLPDVIFVSEGIIQPMAPLEEDDDDDDMDTVKEEIVTDFDQPNQEYLHLPILEDEVIVIEDTMQSDETPACLQEENCTYLIPKTHESIKNENMPITNDQINKIGESSDLHEEVDDDKMQVYEFHSPKYLNIEQSLKSIEDTNKNVVSKPYALKNVILEYSQEILT